MSAGWREIDGVTVLRGQPRLPCAPQDVVNYLSFTLVRGRAQSLSLAELTELLRAEHGGERSRIEGLLTWLGQTHVARWTEEGLSLHPATNLQDLAFRLAAWAGVQATATDATSLQKWVHELLKTATAHPQALKRPTTSAKTAGDWVRSDWPAAADGPSTPDSEPKADPLTARLQRILTALDGSLLERTTHTRAVLLALLAGQHALLLGPPGTAKSLMARAMCAVFEDATYFEYLLSRFTHPDELFGPVSIPGLKVEDYRRLTEGFLPQAHVAFLDEVFKANSAILNSLLTLINERV
ncbi:MAG: AAA family ATPase, partial [Myxococcota bacterium]